MTKAKLERGNELSSKINSLKGIRADLEKMRGMCSEDIDNGVNASRVYCLQSMELETLGSFSIDVSVTVAYRVVSEEVEKIKKEIASLEKEFFEL